MRFVRAQCAACRLSFRVVVKSGDRMVQVERARWSETCHLARTCVEPRMCDNLRRAVRAVETPPDDTGREG